MREELLAIIVDAQALQARMDALLSPSLTEVPSVAAPVITWVTGKLQRL